MSSTIPVNAEAYARMLREIQTLRAAEPYGGAMQNVLRLRQGVITARDPATYTVSVRLGASEQSPNTEDSEYPDVIDGVELAAPVYPVVGDSVFVAMQGAGASVPCVLFTRGPVGAVRIVRTSDQGIPQATMTNIVFPSGSGTDIRENTDGMYNPVVRTDGITIQWPGRYTFGGCVRFGSVVGNVEAITSLRVSAAGGGATVELIRDSRASVSNASFPTGLGAVDINLAAGQILRLSCFVDDIDAFADFQSEYSPMMYATWRSPP